MAVSKKKLRWEPIPTNTRIAGVRILKIVKFALQKENLTYEVEFECCGMISNMTHLRIQRRARDEQTLCFDCGRHRKTRRQRELEEGPLSRPQAQWPAPNNVGQRKPIW